MVAPRSEQSLNAISKLARQLAWPTAISCALAAFAACGGSSEGDTDFDNPTGGTGGKGGSVGVSGSTGTKGGQGNGTSGSTTGGKQTGGGETSVGGDPGQGPEDGGDGPGPGPGEGGAPGVPDPMHPPGMAGAGGADADCPAEPPKDKAACTTVLKCKFAETECNCDGPEKDRRWHCKEPPKPMDECPPMAPKDGAACETAEPPAPPCHYDEPAVVDCNCAADKWACTEAP